MDLFAEAKGFLPSEFGDHIPENVSEGSEEEDDEEEQYLILKQFVINCGPYTIINGIELPIFYNAPLDWQFYDIAIRLTLLSLSLQVFIAYSLFAFRNEYTIVRHADCGAILHDRSMGRYQKE